MSTHYTVQVIDPAGHVTQVGDTISKLDKAKELAGAQHLELEGTSAVQVITDTGKVSFEIPMNEPGDQEVKVLEDADAPEPVVTEARRRTKPFTKTEPLPDWIDPASIPEGYTLAYVRSRVKLGVYRANDKSDWLVVDYRDGSSVHYPNTETARVQGTNVKVAAYNAEVKAARDKMREDRRLAREKARLDKAENDKPETVDA